MEQEIAELRRFVEATWPRNPHEEPSVRRWLAAKRAMLLVLLAFAGLQYYFFDVHLTIMALPRLAVAGPLS